MNRGPVLLAVGGLVFAILLFQLPKVVVDDGEDTLAEGPTVGASNEEDGPANHAQPIPDALRPIIARLRRNVTASDNQEELPIFADSLADAYFSATWYDSAGYFASIVADSDPSLVRLKKAADYHYEAFSFAISGTAQTQQATLAGEYLQKVLDLDPDDEDAKAKLGMTFVVSDNPMQGVLMLREVVEKNPANIMAQFNLGMLSRQSGQLDKALERFETVLDIDPANLQAKFFLGLTFVELGDKDQGRQTLEELLQMTTDPVVIQTVEDMLSEME